LESLAGTIYQSCKCTALQYTGAYMKIILAGATGFIGGALVKRLLQEQHALTLLTRNPSRYRGHYGTQVTLLAWDAHTQGEWAAAFNGADAVINLAGESMAARRWTRAQKHRLVQSRLQSTRALVEAIAQSAQGPQTLINVSAVGYYGNVPTGDVTEQSAQGHDFLAETCVEWEQEALRAHGVRVVLPRIGVVLGPGGGALEKMLPPFRLFAGGPIGTGQQWMPWVHRDDVVNIMLHMLHNTTMHGPCNVTAPTPVTMYEFCATLSRVLRRPSWLPVPGIVLKVLLGEMAEMLLGGQRAMPQALQEQGYTFQYATLEPALQALLCPASTLG
jgi:uncharacterized protein